MPSCAQAIAAQSSTDTREAASQRWHLAWDRGQAEIFATGAALHNLVFLFDDGFSCQPLAEAPWIGEAGVTSDRGIPAHLRTLGGEWPCVPFGTTGIDPHHHGFGTDKAWQVTDEAAGAIELAIDYPADHPIARLERRVSGVPGETAVDLELAAIARADCMLPVGLHPIFRLPDAGKRMNLSAGGLSRGHTFPRLFESGVSRLAVGKRFASLDAVPLADGSFADLTSPPANLREEIVLLEGVDDVTLGYSDDGYTVRFAWHSADFPSLVLWLSDRGRSQLPWSNRFRGIGIEPMAGFFDNTDLAAQAPEGLALGRRFSAGERWTTYYRISASRPDAGQTEGTAQ